MLQSDLLEVGIAPYELTKDTADKLASGQSKAVHFLLECDINNVSKTRMARGKSVQQTESEAHMKKLNQINHQYVIRDGSTGKVTPLDDLDSCVINT